MRTEASEASGEKEQVVMPDLNRPRLYVILCSCSESREPHLFESKRIESVYPRAPSCCVVKRAADRELHALAQAGVTIEVLK